MAAPTRTPRCRRCSRQTVDRLVAASERPDLKYKVTILNSPAINAFALPNGQLYVTRGLVALANDKSELASVLAHEMAHVIARHAAIREDQARQAAIVSRVVTDVLERSADRRAGARQVEAHARRASRARRSSRPTASASASRRAPASIRTAPRASSPRWSATPHLRAQRASIDPRAPDFLSSHPATPERVKNARRQCPPVHRPGAGERDEADYLARLDGMVYGEDPSEGFVRGRRFLHPKLGFTFTAPEGFTLDNTAQAVLGLKDGGARRCASTWCACRPSSRCPTI